VTFVDDLRDLMPAAVLENKVLALGAMATALALVCALTAVDRLARTHKGIAGAVIAAWCGLAPVGLLRASIVGDPLAESAWAACGIYLIAILSTLGRPLLIASDIVEREGGYQVLSKNEYRRSRAGQLLLLVGICALAALTF
jgi:Na+/H+ antiporter NhaD/arsenite permease-like protein